MNTNDIALKKLKESLINYIIKSIRSGSYRPVSLTSIPGKMMQQLILEIIIKQVEEKKVIRST